MLRVTQLLHTPGLLKLLPSPGEVSESEPSSGTACTNDPAMPVFSFFLRLSFSSGLRVFLPVFCARVSFSQGTGHIRPARCETRYICCCCCLRLHLLTASHPERTSPPTECEGPPASFVFRGLAFNCLPSPDVAAPGSLFTQISTCSGWNRPDAGSAVFFFVLTIFYRDIIRRKDCVACFGGLLSRGYIA